MPIHFVQIPGFPKTNASQPTPIPGLSLDIPAGAGEQALIILNVTHATATGSTHPEGWFGLYVDGVGLHYGARFSNPTPVANETYYLPVTLVAAVELKPQAQKVQAMWYGTSTGADTVTIGPSSLTVTVG